jgi:hypothetical protein
MVIKFERWNRSELAEKLRERGWSARPFEQHKPNRAGQLHLWYKPSGIRGHLPQHFTLQNAARREGLAR